MARPSKWGTPTTAIRVPEHLAEALLAIARSLEGDVPSAKPDPEMAAYLSFVQNSIKPKLLTIRDSEDDFKEHHYIIQADPLSFTEYQQVKQISERIHQEIFDGLSAEDRLYLLSKLAQEIFPEHHVEDLGGRSHADG